MAARRPPSQKSVKLVRSGQSRDLNKWEDKLFKIIYVLLDKRTTPKLKNVFFVSFTIADYFFFLTAIVGASDEPSSAWDPGSFQWLQAVSSRIPLMKQEGSFRIPFFWLVISAFLMAAFAAGYISRFQQQQDRKYIWAFKLLQALMGILLAIYIPVLRALLDGFSGAQGSEYTMPVLQFPNIMYTIVASVLLALYVPLCAVLATLYYDNSPVSADMSARTSGRGDVVYLGTRTLLVCAGHFSIMTSPIVALALLLMTLSMTAYTIVMQPYYNARICQLRAALFGALATVCFGNFILSIAPSDETMQRSLSTAFFALSVAIAIVAATLAWLRLRRVIYVKPLVANAAQPYLADPSRRGVSDPSQHGPVSSEAGSMVGATLSIPPGVRFPWDLEIRTRFLRSCNPVLVTDLEHARSIFHSAPPKWRDTPYMNLTYAVFASSYNLETNLVLHHLQKASTLRPWFDARFRVYVVERDLKKADHASALGEGGVDSISLMEFNRNYSNAKRYHNTAIMLLRKFWKRLLNRRTEPTQQELFERVSSIHSAVEDGKRCYKKLLTSWPSSVILHRSFAIFLRDAANDLDGAALHEQKAESLEQLKRRRFSDANADSDNTSSKCSSFNESTTSDQVTEQLRRRRKKGLRVDGRNVRAIFLMSVGIIAGLLIIAGITVTSYLVLRNMVESYNQSVSQVNQAGFRRTLVPRSMMYARSMSLAARQNDAATFASSRDKMSADLEALRLIHHQLYFSPTAGGGSTGSPTVKALWLDKTLDVRDYVPDCHGCIDGIVISKNNLWDVGNSFIIVGREIATLNMSQAVDMKGSTLFRFMFDNGLRAFQIGNKLATLAYEEEIYDKAVVNAKILGALFGGTISTLLVLAFCVFQPTFKKVEETKKGISTVTQHLPRRIVLALYKHYKKFALLEDRQSHDKDFAQHDGGSPDLSEVGSEGWLSPSAGPSPKLELTKDNVQLVATHFPLTGLSVKDSPYSQTAPSESCVDRQRLKLLAVGQDDQRPIVDVLALSLSQTSVALPRRPFSHQGGMERPSAATVKATFTLPNCPAEVEEPDSMIRPTPEDLVARPMVGEGEGEANALPRDMEVFSSRTESEKEAERHQDGEGARVTVLKSSSQSESETDREEESWGAGHPMPPLEAADTRSTLPVMKVQNIMGKTGKTRSNAELEVLPSKSGRGDQRLSHQSGRRKVSPEDDGYQDGQIMEKVASQSIYSVALSSAVVTASPVGILKRVSLPHSKLTAEEELERESDEEPAVHEVAVDKWKGEGNGRGNEGHMKTERHKHKGPPAKVEGVPVHGKDGQEVDVGQEAAEPALTKTGKATKVPKRRFWHNKHVREYVAAFAVIGAIAVANFVVAYGYIDSAKFASAEINNAGRRRYLSRETQFLLRELLINDNLLDNRENLIMLLNMDIELLTAVHAGLRYGNSSMHLPGADARYPAQDELMYESGCLRISGVCPPQNYSPLEKAIFLSGYDALIQYFLRETSSLVQSQQQSSPQASPNYNVMSLYKSSLSLNATWRASEQDLFEGSQRSLWLFLEEYSIRADGLYLVEVLYLSVSLVFLLCIYLFVFRPMVSRLRIECSRTHQLITLIPLDFVAKAPVLQSYFTDEPAIDT